ncbi:MAG: trypsin-like peptidase domain-containing protein [Planctomycetes bacterium]|nr:trypsin-like peptidase domain-containing protein [Planctomycetota bacterium]
MLELLLLAAIQLPVPLQTDPNNPRITPEVRVVQSASPSVVYIEAAKPGGWYIDPASTRGLSTRTLVTGGSGVVIDKSGYIVTNSHVIAGASKVHVQFAPQYDETLYEAEVVSEVPSEDLALLKIRGPKDFPVVTMGTSSDLMIGERVIVIGNPLGQNFSVSSGIISGLHRDLAIDQDLRFPDLLQTDASINPGNSGGPVLNVLGEMIGMATVVNQRAENMGFAIPIDRIKEVLQDELLAPSSARAYLGIELAADTLEIGRITPKGPADQAGLQVGDKVVGLNGERVESAKEFHLKRLPLRAPTPIQLSIERKARTFDVSLKAWNKIDGILYERAGLTTDRVVVGNFPLLCVRNVCPDGPAAALGLEPEDLIEALRVGEARPVFVSSAVALAAWLSQFPAGTAVEIDVLRDDNHDRKYSQSEELYKGVLTLR